MRRKIRLLTLVFLAGFVLALMAGCTTMKRMDDMNGMEESEGMNSMDESNGMEEGMEEGMDEMSAASGVSQELFLY
jgi:hypothetical protein